MTKLSTRSFATILVAGALVFCFALAGMNNRWWGWFEPVAKNTDQSDDATELIPEGFVKHGGVIRPKKDVFGPKDRKRRPPREPINVGLTPVVNRNANANTKSLAKTEDNPELAKNRSMLQVPEPFDREAYLKNPQAYIDEVVAGRIWQPAKPSKKTATIQRVGKYRHQLVQGETVTLRVNVESGMPVHFASERLGQFENQLPTITVRADKNGRATTRFTASGGTRDFIDLVASSPVHSGYARWLIEISQPKKK